ncbi:hypothetical protein ACMXZI_17065 [Bacillus subtilis]|uniref:Uncharacterized protein n=1 Tax=Bacillus subtilis TaxID=1423 RepID=A0A8I1WDH3_BACIU|nr:MULTISPECIES: hypothetical protein [Bacillus]AMK72805.1 hypothetical protein AWV81_12035 [Bacillus subtilis subsp. natto]AOR98656.1 hypothetical protein BSBS38_02377 [Bacillus subtilis]AOS68411.1 hypothetical protein A4A60_12410 [Bacillus subtilis]API42508.1 hypothetical protein BSR08_08305 [Bacillus subtilis]API94440.1 hypothetical protein BKP58_00300 [Bacillus subtilis]
MEQLISVLVFSLPGLLAYFWIQILGINPAVKHNAGELVGLSALLWIPVSLINVLIMNIISSHFHWWSYMKTVGDIKSNAEDIHFLTFFTIITLFSSLLVSAIWAVFLYGVFLSLINKIRLFRNIVPLNETTSIWDTFFLAFDVDKKIKRKDEKKKKEETPPLVVEIYYLNNPDNKMYGAVSNMSRPFEAERALILQEPDEWKQAYQTYNYPVKKTYVDSKSGLVVNELNITFEAVVQKQ